MEGRLELVDGIEKFIDKYIKSLIDDPEKVRSREKQISAARTSLLKALAEIGVACCTAGA